MKPITCLVAATVAGALAISAHAQVNTDAGRFDSSSVCSRPRNETAQRSSSFSTASF